MDRFEHAALLTTLIDSMRKAGSWCGETHIQKGTYFLQKMLKVPMAFKFILYKHGPFSFDLRDALATMRSDHFIDIDIQPYPYGPRLDSTDSGRAFEKQCIDFIRPYLPRIDFVAERLKDSKVAELERYATALYVSDESNLSERERAITINGLKPHVSLEEAIEAVRFVDRMSIDAEALLNSAA